ncbi:MAG TPA: hypothetical protein VGW33_15335 [Terriglobia bacterium]|nr:hypothetical protein [Terriglobia bacterium]
MAVSRTILPRKGLVQPQHGLTGYEADQDANWLLLDSNVAFITDLQFQDLGLNGVVSGFTLSTAPTLTPGLTPGVLYAQGLRYAPAAAPVLSPAAGSSTQYLFYNSISGFYYQASAVGASAGDALVGRAVTSATAVTSVAPGTRLYGQVALAPATPGNFTVAHLLGRTPVGATVQMTSSGAIWFQPAPMFDAANLYLVASGPGVTAQVEVW